MIKNRSKLVRAAVVAGVMAMLLGPAGASAQPATIPLTGDLTIGSFAIPLPTGTNVAATWDADSGDFSGTLFFPVANQSVEIPGIGPVPLTITITATEVVGNVPADGTTGSVTTALTANIVALGGTVNCDLGPINLELATFLRIAGDPTSLEATASGFNVPAVAVSPTCAIAATVNSTLVLPSTATSVLLQGPTGATTTTTTAVTTTTVETAAPAAATPKFTG